MHCIHEDSHRTIARALGGRYRGGIARSQDLEVRYGTRKARACSPQAATHYVPQCHRRSDRLRGWLTDRPHCPQEGVLARHGLWPETSSLILDLCWRCLAAATIITNGL